MHPTIFVVVVVSNYQLGFPEFICHNRRWMVVDEGGNSDVGFYGDLEQAEELRRILQRFEWVRDGLMRIRIDEYDRDSFLEQYPDTKINFFYPEGCANSETPELPALPLHQVEEFIFPANQGAVPTSRLRPSTIDDNDDPFIIIEGFNI